MSPDTRELARRAAISETNRARVAQFNADRLEDLTFLAETGESLTGAARRLGTTPANLSQWIRRHAPHLRQPLRDNEPRRTA